MKTFISPKEFQALSGLSRNVVYEAVRRKQIPSIRVGRRILIPAAAINQLVEEAIEAAAKTQNREAR
jgi:excisionase family DNA binding protein